MDGVTFLIHWVNQTIRLGAILAVYFACFASGTHAQGGPPFYTNDPGTPGNKQWEINLGYMPFLFNANSITHTPDVDINFGLGDRIQLTFENAYLRVNDAAGGTRFGLGQDQLGLKWRFYDNEKSGFAISVFPQVSLNNPNSSVDRGITPRGASLILPMEFSKKLGPLRGRHVSSRGQFGHDRHWRAIQDSSTVYSAADGRKKCGSSTERPTLFCGLFRDAISTAAQTFRERLRGAPPERRDAKPRCSIRRRNTSDDPT